MPEKDITGNLSQEAVVAKTKAKSKKPNLYKVVIFNDDFTPMDFVVYTLKNFFNKPHEEAVKIMLEVHNKGSAKCGTYTRDVAETKVEQVISFARRNEHPLRCAMEKE